MKGEADFIVRWGLLFTLGLGLILPMSGCRTEMTSAVIEELTWEPIEQSSWPRATYPQGYAGHEPRLVVILNPEEAAPLEGPISTTVVWRIIDDVDFFAYFVVVIFQGLQEYEYSIEVEEIKREGKLITIYADFLPTESEGDQQPVATSPYFVLKVRRTDELQGDFTFVLNVDGEDVVRQSHSITYTPRPLLSGAEGEPLEWEKIALTDFSSGYEEAAPTMRIAAIPEQVSEFEGLLLPPHLELVHNTDFSRCLVIAVFQGEKATTGYSVEVVDVRLDGNAITVYARFLTPDPRFVTGQLVTSPYYVLRIKKTPGLRGNFTFVLIANSEEIMRQEHSIP